VSHWCPSCRGFDGPVWEHSMACCVESLGNCLGSRQSLYEWVVGMATCTRFQWHLRHGNYLRNLQSQRVKVIHACGVLRNNAWRLQLQCLSVENRTYMKLTTSTFVFSFFGGWSLNSGDHTC
jgi:hypothetical protein